MTLFISQLLMLLFVWNFFWQPTNHFFLLHTNYAYIRSSCIYEDVNYLLKIIYIFGNYPKLCWAS